MNKSIVLLSGGLDSLISLVYAKDEYNIQLALTFDYGQRAVKKEIDAAKTIAEYFNIEHKVIKTPWLQEITETSLVNTSQDLPSLDSNELDNPELTLNSAKNVWVPNRNGVFLNIAACFADSFSYSHIIFGANKEEGTTFPDNTQEFIDKINEAFEFSTLAKPKVFAPLINLNKTEIIELALEIEAPLTLVRSCYTDEEKHCGKCESCLRFKRALEANGKTFADIGI
ncbi:MAG: 7-cyano-7-deazaguanine synthase QueC [Candidatus Melainabacteria bacterium GWA2_34_9]|nr:MAG: 7-cyano-7-deazaguanine synthase QueC [Candidatus Melainabacteria bacterium GWA2_34_9]